MLWLFLIFVALPILEIVVLAQVAGEIGWGWALFWIVAVSVIGAVLVKQAGISTLRRANERVRRGELPAEEMVGGIVLLVAGALMLTPGFATDAVGLVLLLPPTRALMAGAVRRRFRAGPLFFSGPGGGGFTTTWRSGIRGRHPGAGQVWDASSTEVGDGGRVADEDRDR